MHHRTATFSEVVAALLMVDPKGLTGQRSKAAAEAEEQDQS